MFREWGCGYSADWSQNGHFKRLVEGWRRKEVMKCRVKGEKLKWASMSQSSTWWIKKATFMLTGKQQTAANNVRHDEINLKSLLEGAAWAFCRL